MARPDIRSTPATEFALVCGGVHFLLAVASSALAVSAADDLGDVVFFIAVGYFAAFSVWLAIRAWLLLSYLGERPPRGASSAIAHLAGGLVVLFVSGVFAGVGPVVIALGLFGAAFVVPSAATAWAIQPYQRQHGRRNVAWTVAGAVVLCASTALLALLLVTFWPRHL